MLCITAVIRCKAGYDNVMANALLEVAEHVRVNEPDTRNFFVARDSQNPCIFTTYERFTTQQAVDKHNTSAVVQRFFDIAKPILDGDVTLVLATEISADE